MADTTDAQGAAGLSPLRRPFKRLGDFGIQLSDVGILSILGLFAYAFARFAADAFFKRFKVAPEDVGLGYAAILGPAAFLAVEILLLTGLAILAIAALPESIKRWPGRLVNSTLGFLRLARLRPALSTLLTVLLAQLVDLLFIALWVGLAFGVNRFVDWLLPRADIKSQILRVLLLAPPLALVVTYLIADLVRSLRRIWSAGYEAVQTEKQELDQEEGKEEKHERTKKQEEEQRVSRLTDLLQAGIGLTGLAALLLGAHQFGAHQADLAVRGKVVEVQIMGIWMPGLSARPASIVPIAKDTNLESYKSSPCLMHIGEGGGFAMLYDPISGRTIQVPTEAALISYSTDNRTRCNLP